MNVNELNIGYPESEDDIDRLIKELQQIKNDLNNSELEPRNIPALFENSNLLRNVNNPTKHDLNNHDLTKPEVRESEIINGWTEGNCNTVKKWQDDIEKTSFLYGEILFQKVKYLQIALVAILVIGAVNTLLTTLSVTLAFLDQKWLGVSFTIVAAVGSGAITILGGLIVILDWRNIIRVLTQYLEKLNGAWFTFETELSMEAEERQNAKDFIKRNDGLYHYLLQMSPPIDGNDYIAASHKFKERLFSDRVWNEQFNQRVNNQLIQVNNHENNQDNTGNDQNIGLEIV